MSKMRRGVSLSAHVRKRIFGGSSALTGLMAFCLTLGCDGVLSGGAGDAAENAGKGSADGGGVPGPDGSPSASTEPLGPTLRLLTRAQYQASLRALFSFADSLDYSGLEDDV